MKNEIIKILKELNIINEERNNSEILNETNNINKNSTIKNELNFSFDSNNLFSDKDNNIISLESNQKKSNIHNFKEEYVKITMKYEIKKNDRNIKILGEKFCSFNKDNCKIIYNGQEYPLESYFLIEDIKDDISTIELKIINNIISADEMFYKCSSLISLTNISNWKFQGDSM